MLRNRAVDRPYYLHRPHGCTALVIEHERWPGNEFGLWMPETILADDEYVWGNREADPHQEWRSGPEVEAWAWETRVAGLALEAKLWPDEDGEALWCRYRFTNESGEGRKGVGTHTCFHLADAPQFISVSGERIWACLDGGWTTTDRVPRCKSMDPNRVKFLRRGLNPRKQVIQHEAFPSATLGEQAHHPLIVAEAFGGKGSVGVAGRNWQYLFNNNDCILRCLHGEPGLIDDLAPGESAEQELVILFCQGGREELLDVFETMAEVRGDDWLA